MASLRIGALDPPPPISMLPFSLQPGVEQPWVSQFYFLVLLLFLLGEEAELPGLPGGLHHPVLPVLEYCPRNQKRSVKGLGS